MSDLVRVRLDKGDTWLYHTVGADYAAAHTLDVLTDEPAHDRTGRVLGPVEVRKSGRPAKKKVSLAQPGAGKNTAPGPAETAEEAQ